MATTHTEYGRFINHYRLLERHERLADTPILLSEGDSWFSTPLYQNLVDWLEIDAPEALFLRMEQSGDLATRMFSGGNLRSIGSRLKAFEFDVLLLSAGGNDFVDRWLRDLFRASSTLLSAEAAIARVVASGRYDEVRRAWQRMVDVALRSRPGLAIVAHTYDYPRIMGQPARLTVEQLGLAALLKREIGDWIARHVQHVLPDREEQARFARGLIDEFHARVLLPLRQAHPQQFHIAELRGVLGLDSDWNDEMHPSAAGFRRLAETLRMAVREALPVAKRAGLG